MLRRNFCGSLIAAGAIARLAHSQLQQFQVPRRRGAGALQPGSAAQGKGPARAAGAFRRHSALVGGYGGQADRRGLHRLPGARDATTTWATRPGLGTPGTIGDHVLGNERDTDEVARVLGCKAHFDLNYNNHRMGDVSLNELIGRLIFLIRLLQGGHRRLLGSVGARRRESRSLHDRQGAGGGLLDGRPRARFRRAVRGRAEAEDRCRTNTISRAVPRSRAWWTSASRSIRRWMRFAPTSPRARRPLGFAPARRAGEAQSAPAAAGRRRRHRRPQLHQGIQPHARPRVRQAVRRRICRSVSLHCRRAPRARTSIRASRRTSSSTRSRRNKPRPQEIFLRRPSSPVPPRRSISYSMETIGGRA